MPPTKEPQGLLRSDGKRPDGLTLSSDMGHVTAVWPLADSYIHTAAQNAVAALAAARNTAKYTALESRYIF